MSWAVGFDARWKRDIGYGVPAVCDHPECAKEISRGLSYVCCDGQPYGGERGCGLYFCYVHCTWDSHQCERCEAGAEPFEAKPDVPQWVEWKLTDDSWAEWRAENPSRLEELAKRQGKLG